MTLKEKIEQVQSAYKVLKPYVKQEEYLAYLNGLIDARELEVSAKEKSSDLVTYNARVHDADQGKSVPINQASYDHPN
jgi:hypothetical protein